MTVKDLSLASPARRGELIRACDERDFDAILETINGAAQAYKGVIPSDRWHEPYMPRSALAQDIADGVCFWAMEADGLVVGVMGVQDKGPVTLIRHAYVRTAQRRQGTGSRLLRFLEARTEKPILIGTWRDARWAIAFYEKHGYRPSGRWGQAPARAVLECAGAPDGNVGRSGLHGGQGSADRLKARPALPSLNPRPTATGRGNQPCVFRAESSVTAPRSRRPTHPPGEATAARQAPVRRPVPY